jgi:uncharacterized membrane protein YbhN (UPF0104 family)
MSEDLHAEFMWLTLVQDIMKNSEVVVVVVLVFILLLQLASKLENCIMVEASKRIVNRFQLWIAIFFSNLGVLLCGGDDHYIGAVV